MTYLSDANIIISTCDLRRLRSLADDLVADLDPVGGLLLRKLA